MNKNKILMKIDKLSPSGLAWILLILLLWPACARSESSYAGAHSFKQISVRLFEPSGVMKLTAPLLATGSIQIPPTLDLFANSKLRNAAKKQRASSLCIVSICHAPSLAFGLRGPQDITVL
jgi:hypothetical protein